MTFQDFTLCNEILKSIAEVGYTTPSPIQEKAIPVIINGQDVVGCAQTGTGKTAAFAIPILQLLSYEKRNYHKTIKTLILTPTRELAIQIYENFEQYGSHLSLRSAVIFGGVGQVPQIEKLKRGVDILIATPGRLGDLYNQGHIDLKGIEIFVLDEADRMLDMGFVREVKKIISYIPKDRQTLLFSATMPTEIKELATTILRNPVQIEVTPVSSTAQTVSQEIYHVDKPNKTKLLHHLITEKFLTQVLVFTRTKYGADKVVRELTRLGLSALAIHGDKSQTARQNALTAFKQGEVPILVATDIAARGIDISELPYVINYDLPNIPETYVHRIGRTGRAGITGKSISFCNFDEKAYLKDIQKLIGKEVPVVKDHPYPMEILELTPKVEKPPRVKKEATQKKAPKDKTSKTTKNSKERTSKSTTDTPPSKKGTDKKKTTSSRNKFRGSDSFSSGDDRRKSKSMNTAFKKKTASRKSKV